MCVKQVVLKLKQPNPSKQPKKWIQFRMFEQYTGTDTAQMFPWFDLKETDRGLPRLCSIVDIPQDQHCSLPQNDPTTENCLLTTNMYIIYKIHQ